MKGEIELYNISFLILKVELHFNMLHCMSFTTVHASSQVHRMSRINIK